MRRTWTLAALALGAAGGTYLTAATTTAPVGAARAKPSLEVTFAPAVVEGRAAATAFLAVRNTGGAVSNLVLGDRIDVLYASGAAATALAFTGSKLQSSALPSGLVQQDALSGETVIGVSLVATGPVTIDAGATLLVPFDFVAGEPGIAPVSLALSLKKGAGKYPRSLATHVGKSAPRSDVFYGDGADGPLTITSNQAFPQLGSFTDVTIATGAVVTVASGTTIRCTGTFENNGTIVVLSGNPGGGERLDAPSGPIDVHLMYGGAYLVPERGDALRAPTRPTLMEGQASSGALGGVGLDTRVYQLPLSHYRTGGGGGSGGFGAVGGDGGGLFRVIARGEVRNLGTISAPGTVPTTNRAGNAGGGAGGGAGGIVILVSGSRVDSAGTIDVRGANGGPPDGLGGSGGGGGGGLVIFAAPQIGAFGATLLAAGVTVEPSGSVAAAIWAGGGGGGACVGNGGDGYGVSSTGVLNGILDAQSQPVGARPPQPGQLVTFEADPRTIW